LTTPKFSREPHKGTIDRVLKQNENPELDSSKLGRECKSAIVDTLYKGGTIHFIISDLDQVQSAGRKGPHYLNEKDKKVKKLGTFTDQELRKVIRLVKGSTTTLAQLTMMDDGTLMDSTTHGKVIFYDLHGNPHSKAFVCNILDQYTPTTRGYSLLCEEHLD